MRPNGVTILLKGQILLTQDPVALDRIMVANVIHLSREHEKNGRPLSQQTPKP